MSQQRRASRQSSSSDHHNAVTSVLANKHQLALIKEDAVADDQTLGALGYKQEFKR